MKRTLILLATILLALSGCGGGNQPTGDLITVDVTKSYPKKELILQDFMDVEYVPLETSDEFMTQGIPLAIGNEIMLVRNTANRDILIFDRKGKDIRKIDRYGESGEEYIYNYNSILDEENGEIIICDFNKIKIFSFMYREVEIDNQELKNVSKYK